MSERERALDTKRRLNIVRLYSAAHDEAEKASRYCHSAVAAATSAQKMAEEAHAAEMEALAAVAAIKGILLEMGFLPADEPAFVPAIGRYACEDDYELAEPAYEQDDAHEAEPAMTQDDAHEAEPAMTQDDPREEAEPVMTQDDPHEQAEPVMTQDDPHERAEPVPRIMTQAELSEYYGAMTHVEYDGPPISGIIVNATPHRYDNLRAYMQRDVRARRSYR